MRCGLVLGWSSNLSVSLRFVFRPTSANLQDCRTFSYMFFHSRADVRETPGTASTMPLSHMALRAHNNIGAAVPASVRIHSTFVHMRCASFRQSRCTRSHSMPELRLNALTRVFARAKHPHWTVFPLSLLMANAPQCSAHPGVAKQPCSESLQGSKSKLQACSCSTPRITQDIIPIRSSRPVFGHCHIRTGLQWCSRHPHSISI